VTAARPALLIPVALFTAAILGCGVSAPARFYSLDAAASPQGMPLADASVLVGPVTIPDAVDQPQFVIQVAPNRVEVDDFNRWVAPLNDSIARVIATDLAVQLGTQQVATAPMATFTPVYRVAIDVQRFESIRGQSATIEAVWTVRNVSGKTLSGRTVATETVQGDGFDVLAAAHSRALAKVSSDIAATIRAEAAGKP